MKNLLIVFVFLLSGGLFVSCDKDSTALKIDAEFKCNGFSELCDKRLDEVTTLMTHNSYNNGQNGFLVPNQDFNIARQLNDGVRGFMLDVYSSTNGPLLYHGAAQLGKESLFLVMKDIRTFLMSNPNEVISIIFENYCTHEEILQVMDTLEIRDMVYVHNGTWPTLKEMISANKNLVLMVEKQNGVLPEGLLYAWNHTFDSQYEFKNTEEMDCSIKRGGGGLKSFYLMNHWISNSLGLPDKTKAKNANSWAVLGERVNRCSQEQQRKINFLGVDFYNIGDAIAIVDSINGVKR